MNIKTVVVGNLGTNCYILEKNNMCIVIDPGFEEDKIIENISGNLICILITHRHFDHVKALNKLLEYKNVPVLEFSNLKEGKNTIQPFNFEVIYTPGHTNDSVSYFFYEDNVIFTGDFLFREDVGRTDLPTGSEKELKYSIKKISKYNDEIEIYPGHDIKTNLGYEKKNNKYFK